MKLENQVCTLEQAKRLKELGVTQRAEIYFVDVLDDESLMQLHTLEWIANGMKESHNCLAAYSVAELGCMLPDGYSSWKVHPKYEPRKADWACVNSLDEGIHYGNTEAEARAAMLIYLLENNLITAEEVNKRINETINR